MSNSTQNDDFKEMLKELFVGSLLTAFMVLFIYIVYFIALIILG